MQSFVYCPYFNITPYSVQNLKILKKVIKNDSAVVVEFNFFSDGLKYFSKALLVSNTFVWLWIEDESKRKFQAEYNGMNKKQEGMFLDDKKIGIWKYYFDSGELRSEYFYSSESNLIAVNLYDKKGILCEQQDFSNARKSVKKYKDGRLVSVENFLPNNCVEEYVLDGLGNIVSIMIKQYDFGFDKVISQRKIK